MTDAELVILNAELTDDPEGLGYDVSHSVAAATLNEVAAANVIAVGILNGQELQKVVIAAEHEALPAGKRDAWLAIVSAGDGQVDITDQGIIDQVAEIWVTTTTLDNLAGLQTRQGSRAEVLFGSARSVSMFDVAEARGL